MRGSTAGQVTAIIKEIFEEGYDKHSAKAALAGMTNEEKCEHMKVGSYESMDKYKVVFAEIANFAKGEGIKDITKIDNPTICKWADSQAERYGNGEINAKTFGDRITACHRFEAGINMFQERVGGEKVDWSDGREYAKDLKEDMIPTESRIHAYERPEDLVNAPNLSDNEKTLVQFFLDSGCRISEAWKMKPEDISHQGMGGLERVEFHGKGGLDRTVDAPNAGKALEALTELKAEGYSQDKFRDALKEASALTHQDYNGVHGMRHNYAIQNFNDAIKNGATSDEAKKTTAEKLGHFRPDITEVYLK